MKKINTSYISGNIFRRNIMRRITKNLGNSENLNQNPINKKEIKRVLISRPNHRLGNLLLITPLVQEVSNTFPNCKIDLFVKGNLGSVIFQNLDYIDRIINLPKKHFKHLNKYLGGWFQIKKHKYDLVINVVETSSSGRLSTKLANSGYKFFGENENKCEVEDWDYLHMAKGPVYNFRCYLSHMGFPLNLDEVPTLQLKLTSHELSAGKQILQKMVEKEQKTICLFTYATGPKCYDEVWWSNFYNRLKGEFFDFNFVEVLPVENVSQIAFAEPAFYSKDIREIGAFIANTDIFIGADSGIMHLASATGTPVIGLFSVTQPERYAPYGSLSHGVNTNEKNTDDIITEIKKILNRDQLKFVSS